MPRGNPEGKLRRVIDIINNDVLSDGHSELASLDYARWEQLNNTFSTAYADIVHALEYSKINNIGSDADYDNFIDAIEKSISRIDKTKVSQREIANLEKRLEGLKRKRTAFLDLPVHRD